MSRSRVNVHAVVVGYYPDTEQLGELLVVLSRQVMTIHVVDNTPENDTRVADLLAELKLPVIRLTRLGENHGIAIALNIGIGDAITAGATHVLLSDQDSLPEPGMVDGLLHTLGELTTAGKKVGAVAPTFTDANLGIRFPFQAAVPGKFFYGHAHPDASHPVVEAITLITSGTLIPISALEDVGGMREDFFIDHVDIEWCHRARAKGWQLFGTSHARMVHRMGDDYLDVWYFGWRRESAYSPLRIYYRIRNFVLLVRSRDIVWRWKVRNGWYCLGVVYSHVLFGPQKLTCLWMGVRGLVDGVRGVSGPYRG